MASAVRWPLLHTIRCSRPLPVARVPTCITPMHVTMLILLHNFTGICFYLLCERSGHGGLGVFVDTRAKQRPPRQHNESYKLSTATLVVHRYQHERYSNQGKVYRGTVAPPKQAPLRSAPRRPSSRSTEHTVGGFLNASVKAENSTSPRRASSLALSPYLSNTCSSCITPSRRLLTARHAC